MSSHLRVPQISDLAVRNSCHHSRLWGNRLSIYALVACNLPFSYSVPTSLTTSSTCLVENLRRSLTTFPGQLTASDPIPSQF